MPGFREVPFNEVMLSLPMLDYPPTTLTMDLLSVHETYLSQHDIRITSSPNIKRYLTRGMGVPASLRDERRSELIKVYQKPSVMGFAGLRGDDNLDDIFNRIERALCDSVFNDEVRDTLVPLIREIFDFVERHYDWTYALSSEQLRAHPLSIRFFGPMSSLNDFLHGYLLDDMDFAWVPAVYTLEDTIGMMAEIREARIAIAAEVRRAYGTDSV